jgi:hypothetical protein
MHVCTVFNIPVNAHYIVLVYSPNAPESRREILPKTYNHITHHETKYCRVRSNALDLGRSQFLGIRSCEHLDDRRDTDRYSSEAAVKFPVVLIL